MNNNQKQYFFKKNEPGLLKYGPNNCYPNPNPNPNPNPTIVTLTLTLTLTQQLLLDPKKNER